MRLTDTIKKAVDFSKGNGLVTAIAQDADSGEILMVANNERAIPGTHPGAPETTGFILRGGRDHGH